MTKGMSSKHLNKEQIYNQLMTFLKKKILQKLIQIQTFKKQHSAFSHNQTIIKAIHSLFLIYFIIINTDDVLRNPIFTAIKSFNTILLQIQQLQAILVCIILTLSLCMIISFCLLIMGSEKFKFQRSRVKAEKLILKCLVSLSLLFDLLAPILLVFVILNLSLDGLDSAFLDTVSLLCVVLSEVIIVYCNDILVYSKRFVFLLLAFQLIDGLLPYWITIALTLYELLNTPSNKLPYLLVLAISIIAFCGKYFQADINTINTSILFISTILINAFLPQDPLILIREDQNDFLLQRIRKLSKDEELTDKQFLKIALIFQDTQIKHQQLISRQQSQIIARFSSKQISKADLISLTMLKLDIDAKAYPNDLSISIQRHQCLFLSKTFTINTLYQIERLNMEVQTRRIFGQLFRMQAFLNKIQAQYLQTQDDLNSALILMTDKKIERFYSCIGLCIEQLLGIWMTTSKEFVNEQIFSKSLKKVILFEAQAHQILEELKEFKSLVFEIGILNCLHRMANVDGQNLMEAGPFISQEKLKETKFILVSNQIIEDASHIIAKTVSSNKQSLIGLNLSQILFDFYSTFLQEQLTCNRSLFQTHDPILIPFKALNHQKRFFLSQCIISILPDLTNGVKYIINFVKQNQSIKKYALYCLQDDIIQGFSQSFYEVYKINEFLLPDILFGRQVFNIDISKHINESSMNKRIILKCDLMLKDFYDKKKVKSCRQNNSIPLQLKIRDIYQVQNLHYILFEMETKQKTLISNAKETLNMFVKQNANGHSTSSEIIGQTFCKINNPLQSTIDDRLSRIKNHFRVFTYFKIIIFLLLLVFLLIFGSLIYIKLITEEIGKSFEDQLNMTTKTNALAKVIHLLYYQYYQYYQIKNYPEQILSIQPYNVPAIIKEYKAKTSDNIVSMLPYILSNHASSSSEPYTKIFSVYVQEETTSAINLVDFLQSTKTALTTNSPIFLVRNRQITDKIINSFLPLDNQMMEIFQQDMLNYLLWSFVGIIIICVIIKIIYFRICFFKWNIFNIYTEIGQEQLGSYTKRLKNFVGVLVQTKYYDKREQTSDTFACQEACQMNKRDMTSIKVNSQQIQQAKGIKKSSYANKLMDKNLMVIIPILTLFFFIFYFGKISSLTKESNLILGYTKSLQTFSIVLLQRTTSYFQTGMQAILPQTQRKPLQKAIVLKLPTRLDTDLPSYFSSYKQIEKGMLDFNLCKYSYLNTGSLYKGINCSLILDGIMDKSFTQAYSYLLQKLEELGGAKIQDFGKQFRPRAKYPFYMQVCYARRTINNMLAFIQIKFNTTLSGYVRYRQTTTHNTINIGFLIIPIIIVVIIFFLRQIKSQCDFAVKCFKILPRRFIMKISMSKKLKNIGILDEIEMIAA